MMRSPHSVLWLALVLVTMSGCKKKPKPVVAAASAPTITAPVAATPVPMVMETVSNKSPAPVAEPPKTRAKPKPKPRKPAPAKPATTEAKTAPDNATIAKAAPPPRILVQPTPTNSPAEGPPATVVPELTHSEEAHRRQTTEQLMLSTEANLKSLQRVLNPDERSLLQQVRLFMEQSREASQAEDLVRAHNLAMKAHLLSDELVR